MSNAVQYPVQHNNKKVAHYWNEKIKALRAHRREVRTNRARVGLRNDELRMQLREAGLTSRELMHQDTFRLSEVIFADEKIVAAVCGRTPEGTSILLMVTDMRVVCVSHIPLFIDADEFTYDSVSGVSFDMGRWSSTIVLYSAIGNFTIRTSNITAAKNFIDHIQRAVIDNSEKNEAPSYQLKQA